MPSYTYQTISTGLGNVLLSNEAMTWDDAHNFVQKADGHLPTSAEALALKAWLPVGVYWTGDRHSSPDSAWYVNFEYVHDRSKLPNPDWNKDQSGLQFANKKALMRVVLVRPGAPA